MLAVEAIHREPRHKAGDSRGPSIRSDHGAELLRCDRQFAPQAIPQRHDDDEIDDVRELDRDEDGEQGFVGTGESGRA